MVLVTIRESSSATEEARRTGKTRTLTCVWLILAVILAGYLRRPSITVEISRTKIIDWVRDIALSCRALIA